MSTDHARLASLRSFDDERLGIRERFLAPRIGGAGTLAVLTTPLGEAEKPIGWVVCPSFGMEHVHLGPLEVLLARELARRGMPALRYHGQGYGDSDADSRQVSLASHLADARSAIEVLRAEAGVAAVGLVGARFGGSVAILVAADRTITMGAAPAAVQAVAAVEPVCRGGAYLRSLAQREAALTLLERDDSLGREIPAAGIQVGGVTVDGERAAAIEALHLGARVSPFAGRSLVLQLSPTSVPRSELAELASLLGDGSARAELGVIERPDALRFGLPRFRRSGERKVDVQTELTAAIVERVGAWAAALSAEPEIEAPAGAATLAGAGTLAGAAT
ncbi:MAG: hypothetical protein QOH61_662 [Chloroflexota bacterium]|nr:hypothetical protein [Chloroflexota bacterium]